MTKLNDNKIFRKMLSNFINIDHKAANEETTA